MYEITVIKSFFHAFSPHGITGMIIITESHFSIHTWPEYGYAAVDIFTCGTRVDPWKAADFLKEHLEASEIQVRDFRRGIPEENEQGATEYRFIEHASCGSAHN